VLFSKYAKLAEIHDQEGFFLHPAGPVSQKPLEATLYKISHGDKEPDIAILSVADAHVLTLDFETAAANEGQEIQVIGYPTTSDTIDADLSAKFYAPTFNTGRVSRVAPHTLQVDAPISVGNSGGPVVSTRGKVLGVVATRALSARGGELPIGGAVPFQAVQSFAPELFGHAASE
jgi:S1-C subfamily serine protease